MENLPLRWIARLVAVVLILLTPGSPAYAQMARIAVGESGVSAVPRGVLPGMGASSSISPLTTLSPVLAPNLPAFSEVSALNAVAAAAVPIPSAARAAADGTKLFDVASVLPVVSPKTDVKASVPATAQSLQTSAQEAAELSRASGTDAADRAKAARNFDAAAPVSSADAVPASLWVFSRLRAALPRGNGAAAAAVKRVDAVAGLNAAVAVPGPSRLRRVWTGAKSFASSAWARVLSAFGARKDPAATVNRRSSEVGVGADAKVDRFDFGRSESAANETLSREAMQRTVAYLSSPALMGRAPLSEGSSLAREYIAARMKEYGLLPTGDGGGYVQAVKSRLTGRQIGNNVVGYIKGSRKPDEYIYIDAHYDHWGKAGGKIQPGANDNASGVAVMLELARVLARLKPERSIVFLAADLEEGAMLPMFGGLKGASYHVRNLPRPREVKAAVVLDTVGGPFIPGVGSELYMIGSESSRLIYDHVRAKAANEGRALPIRQIGAYAIEPLGELAPRADYGAYRKAGVPFVFATSGIPSEYHSESDTIEKLDFEFMREAGGELLELAKRLSSAEAEPAFQSSDAVIDWNGELAAVDRLIDRMAASTELREKKSGYVESLKREQARVRLALKADSTAGARKKAIKNFLTKSVMTILKMNGSLKVQEHLYRRHGVPSAK